MDKYIIVLGGNKPGTDGCNYLSSVDKAGPHFSLNIEDAITYDNSDRCLYLALGVKGFQTVDVYFVTEKVVRSFELVW